MTFPHLSIAGRRIGADEPPYVVAEISANHDGDLQRALELVARAKACGADAVKIQTYRPDTITLRSDRDEFRIRGGLWDGRTLYDLYEQAHTPWEWHGALFRRAAELGITLFSSPFDHSAVDLLASLNAPAYKIASFELVDLPLIRDVASRGRPMILSTGMAGIDEIGDALEAARSAGARELALLHCVSAYPAPAAEYKLRTMVDMAQRFGVAVGLSDHTLDNTTAIAAVALGACIVEKHFTLDRSAGGPDDSFSLEPPELAALCAGAATAWRALGEVDYGLRSSERGNVQFRRSLYFVRDLEAGEVITADAVRSVRPGLGLPPKTLDQVIGRRTAHAVTANTPVQWDAVEAES